MRRGRPHAPADAELSRHCRWILIIILAGGVSCACSDPIPEEQIEALGPEDPNVPAGPLHRPGQPCVLCHGGSRPGDAEPKLELGGTVYLYNPIFYCQSRVSVSAPQQPAPGVEVEVLDANNQVRVMTTNAAGNFMLERGGNELEYPLWVKLRYNGIDLPMDSRVFRDGSCASCHGMEYELDSAGPVHLVEDQFSELAELFPDPGCPPP